jgi:glycosyltransferase involved in cell wall biosynthesis
MRKPRKVLMIVENDVVPPDTRVWREALALRDHGVQVSIICPKGALRRAVYEDYRAPYEYLEGIHVYRYDLPDGGSSVTYVREYFVALLNAFWLSLRVLIRHGFDVLHVANPPDIFFPMGWFYHLLGKKFVFDQHDLAPEVFQEIFAARMYGPAARLLRRHLLACERYSYLTADLVIAANESFRRIAIKRGGCPADKVFVVRNASVLPQGESARPAQGLKMGRRFLLAYVGVMGIQDGVEYAVRALHELIHVRGRQDVSLVLVGDGSDAAALRALTHELQLDTYATFTGWISPQAVAQNLAIADVGLSPEPHNALNEFSTMIKTMEYMSMGLPIVAFDLHETRNTVQNAGLYAIPNSVSDFANKIELLLNSEELRLAMGSVGRSRALGPLSWECSQERLLWAYDKLFSQPVISSPVDSVMHPSEAGAQEQM